MDNEKKQVTYNSSITGETQVTFDIQQYMNNRAMFIGLMCNEDGYEEPFGDVTVNLSVAAPNYSGYLNVNDMPDIEKFITDNDIGEFTGFTQRSGLGESLVESAAEEAWEQREIKFIISMNEKGYTIEQIVDVTEKSREEVEAVLEKEK